MSGRLGKNAGVYVASSALGLILFLLICWMFGGKEQPSFSDQAEILCKSVNSSVVYSSPAKKVVVCD